MAFDNVTFFELHLDDARFGGERVETLGGSDADEAAAESEPTGRRAFPLGLLVLAVGAAVLARRLRRDADIDVDIEDAEPIAVE